MSAPIVKLPCPQYCVESTGWISIVAYQSFACGTNALASYFEAWALPWLTSPTAANPLNYTIGDVVLADFEKCGGTTPTITIGGSPAEFGCTAGLCPDDTPMIISGATPMTSMGQGGGVNAANAIAMFTQNPLQLYAVYQYWQGPGGYENPLIGACALAPQCGYYYLPCPPGDLVYFSGDDDDPQTAYPAYGLYTLNDSSGYASNLISHGIPDYASVIAYCEANPSQCVGDYNSPPACLPIAERDPFFGDDPP